MSKTRKKSLAKGVVAGLIGGIAGAAARSAVERIYPPQKRRELALTTTGTQETMHLGFGAAVGAAYGAAAEFYPAATSKQGASFGMALIALNRDNVLPALRLAKPQVQSKREHTSELASFVVYGVVTETVRRVVRHMIE